MVARYPASLPAIFDRTFSKYAGRTAVHGPDGSLSFEELDSRSDRIAGALHDHGVGPGDRVGLVLGNGLEFPVVDIGVVKAGAIRVPLHTDYTASDLAFLLADAGVSALVCEQQYVERLSEVTAGIDSLDLVVVTDGPQQDSLPAGETEYRRLPEFLEDREFDVSTPDPAPDDPAALFYTGGTTGKPKGVRYSHRCLVENLQAVIIEFGFDGDDVGMLSTPLSHSAGTFCYAALLAGGSVHLRDGFDPADFRALVDSTEATWTFLVPTMLYRLLNEDVGEGGTGEASEKPADESSEEGPCEARENGLEPDMAASLGALERVLYGAAPIRRDRLREAIDRYGPIFHQFYGQTEVPNLITSLPPQEHTEAVEEGDLDRLSSAGTACLRATVEIRDEETDEPLPPGAVGEVVVTAPYTFDGYHDRPDETDEILRDGRVYTSDIGVLDERGYLTLLDRTSDVIVTGGMNVYSTRVERVLRDHPDIDNAVVIGIPDDEWGEAVHAVVVPRAGTITLEDIDDFLDDRLPGYKQPKSIANADSLPTTTLGKVDRRAIRARYWDEEDRSVH